MFIFSCCMTNCHSHVASSNSHSLAHSSAGEKSGWAWLGSTLRASKAKIKMLATLSCYLETLGENPLPSSFRVLAEPSPMWP